MEPSPDSKRRARELLDAVMKYYDQSRGLIRTEDAIPKDLQDSIVFHFGLRFEYNREWGKEEVLKDIATTALAYPNHPGRGLLDSLLFRLSDKYAPAINKEP